MSELLMSEFLAKHFFGEFWDAIEGVFKTRAGATHAELWECTEGYEEDDSDFNFMFVRVQWAVGEEEFDEEMSLDELEQLDSFEEFRKDLFENKQRSPEVLKAHAYAIAEELYEKFSQRVS